MQPGARRQRSGEDERSLAQPAPSGVSTTKRVPDLISGSGRATNICRGKKPKLAVRRDSRAEIEKMPDKYHRFEKEKRLEDTRF
jgi:hypothetical protein